MSSSQSQPVAAPAAPAPLRTLGDAHAARPFRRLYLGPTPVPTASAATLAQAIANDADAVSAGAGVVRQASHAREESSQSAAPLGLLVAGARASDGHSVGIVGHLPPPPPPPVAPAPATAFGSVNSKASFVKNPAAGESPFTAAPLAAAATTTSAKPEALAMPPQLAIVTTSPSQPVSPISPGTVVPPPTVLQSQPPSAASGVSSFSSASTFMPRRGLIAREQSATSFASFTSAQSLPDSVLSEGDVLARQRAEESPYRPPVRRDVSAYAALGSEATSLLPAQNATPPPAPPSASVPVVTLAPSTSFHARRLSFEVPDERPFRRGRSEGASEALPLLDLPLEEEGGEEEEDEEDDAPSTPRQQRREASVVSQTTPTRRGLLVPSSEHSTPTAQPSTPLKSLLRRPQSAASLRAPSPLSGSPAASTGTPTAIRQRRSFLRGGGSTSASSTLTRAQGRALARRSIGSYDEAAQGDSFDTEFQAAVNAVPASASAPTVVAGAESSPTREAHEAEADLRISLAKARARERFAAVRVGGRASSASAKHPHPRDASRASRMSRASTAGSFATRATDASFTSGTAGMRERFRAAFGAGGLSGSGSVGAGMPSRTKSRTQQSVASAGTGTGAAVGTSAGGTKWVGGSFEVGARFFEVLEARRAAAPKASVPHASPVAEPGAKEARPKATPEAEPASIGRKAAQRSPSDVLNTFAREASEEAEEKRERSGDVLQRVGEAEEPKVSSPDQVLFPEKPLATEPLVDPQTLKKSSVRLSKPPRTTAPGTPKSVAPAPSLLSIPHAKGAAHDSTFVIESRQGWADLVSLMSAHGSGVGVSSPAPLATRKATRELAKLAPGAWPASQAPKTTMTSIEASQHPEPPKGAEERFPEATHELLRRQSYIGTPPNGLRDETASDHAVVVHPQQREEEPVVTHDSAGAISAPAALAPPTPSPRKRKDSSSSFKATLLRSFGGSTPATPTRKVQFEGEPAKPAFTRALSASLAAKMAKTAPASAAGPSRSATGDASPAPPEEVLARPGSGTTTPTATGNSTPALGEEFLTRKTELKRDRMLVKVGWTPHGDVPRDFDELSARRHNVYSDAWREYMVVLRQGRLELWDDPVSSLAAEVSRSASTDTPALPSHSRHAHWDTQRGSSNASLCPSRRAPRSSPSTRPWIVSFACRTAKETQGTRARSTCVATGRTSCC